MNKEILERGDMLGKGTAEFAALYAKDSVMLQGSFIQGFLAVCGALCTHMLDAFSELMWVVVVLTLVDFGLGVLRAIRDPKTRMSWAESLNSIIKVFVIMLGAIGIFALSEMMERISGVDTHNLFSILFLASVGVGEGVRILDHLTFHFPAFKKGAEKIKALIAKGVDDVESK